MKTSGKQNHQIGASQRLSASLLAAAALFSGEWVMGLTGTAQAATAKTTTAPVVLNCGTGKGLTKPASLTVACADSNNLAKDLTWSKWSTTGAAAKGVISWDPCTPTCAADKKWANAAATVTLSDTVHTSKGLLFEKLAVHVTGNAPKNMARNYIVSEAPVSS